MTELHTTLHGYDIDCAFTFSKSGRLVLTSLQISGAAITAEALRKVSISTLEDLARQQFIEEVNLPPLKRTSDMTPEEFSALVAKHYRYCTTVVRHPAAEMAKQSGAKISTVHAWIREARLRGLLPAGSRKK